MPTLQPPLQLILTLGQIRITPHLILLHLLRLAVKLGFYIVLHLDISVSSTISTGDGAVIYKVALPRKPRHLTPHCWPNPTELIRMGRPRHLPPRSRLQAAGQLGIASPAGRHENSDFLSATSLVHQNPDNLQDKILHSKLKETSRAF